MTFANNPSGISVCTGELETVGEIIREKQNTKRNEKSFCWIIGQFKEKPFVCSNRTETELFRDKIKCYLNNNNAIANILSPMPVGNTRRCEIKFIDKQNDKQSY